jgi:hypothetical protein
MFNLSFNGRVWSGSRPGRFTRGEILRRRPDGPQSRSGRCGGEKILLVLPAVGSQVLGLSACSSVTMTTEWTQRPCCQRSYETVDTDSLSGVTRTLLCGRGNLVYINLFSKCHRLYVNWNMLDIEELEALKCPTQVANVCNIGVWRCPTSHQWLQVAAQFGWGGGGGVLAVYLAVVARCLLWWALAR